MGRHQVRKRRRKRKRVKSKRKKAKALMIKIKVLMVHKFKALRRRIKENQIMMEMEAKEVRTNRIK